MIPRLTQPASSASRAADTENLNTDVMRFMAILGLCLAAIFALVQSVPTRSSDEPPAKPSTDTETPDETRAREQLTELSTEIARLREQAGKTREQHRNATRALALTRAQLSTDAREASRVRREQQQAEAELKDLHRQLREQRSELDEVNQTLRQTGPAPAVPERRPVAEREQPDRALRSAPPPQSQPAVAQKPVDPSGPAAPPAAGKGFTLRFASSDALEHLVARRTVSLYGMLDKQAWRLALPAGRPGFTPDAFPARYHEMTPETVPADYVQALQQTPGFARGRVPVWGVGLPAQTQAAIEELTRNLRGGDLVIRSDGKVYLNEEAPGALGR